MKTFLTTLTIIILGAGLPGLSAGATLADIEGDYPVSMTAKFKVKKLGSDTRMSSGLLTLSQSGTFFLDDYTTPHDVSGDITLDSKGKKVFYSPSVNGLSELESVLNDWLTGAAADAGIGLTGLDFTFTQVKPSKVKIDKRTGLVTGEATLSVKGVVTGYVDGEYIQTKFTYKAKALIQ
jgi:hypothetical protein